MHLKEELQLLVASPASRVLIGVVYRKTSSKCTGCNKKLKPLAEDSTGAFTREDTYTRVRGAKLNKPSA